MADSGIDALVDQIAARVKARLGGGTALPVIPLREQPCDEDPANCSGCGQCVVRRPWAAKAVVAEGASRLGAGEGTGEVDNALASMIDHTLLKPEATAEDLKRLCDEARRYHFASVCVNSANVPRV